MAMRTETDWHLEEDRRRLVLFLGMMGVGTAHPQEWTEAIDAVRAYDRLREEYYSFPEGLRKIADGRISQVLEEWKEGYKVGDLHLSLSVQSAGWGPEVADWVGVPQAREMAVACLGRSDPTSRLLAGAVMSAIALYYK